MASLSQSSDKTAKEQHLTKTFIVRRNAMISSISDYLKLCIKQSSQIAMKEGLQAPPSKGTTEKGEPL